MLEYQQNNIIKAISSTTDDIDLLLKEINNTALRINERLTEKEKTEHQQIKSSILV